ncbi:MAG: hypothetical protein Solumvirus4_10 [Solumvirus sp.]|uniref:MORN repeat-containing protein n=1 Tax=Solumvirus sp. TaxID=2487773 RepID=A0A3G5AGK5_9VIRU|nr:MAG: hypothetical protein Solumvirus4_10 [Solumvirus sp.]
MSFSSIVGSNVSINSSSSASSSTRSSLMKVTQSLQNGSGTKSQSNSVTNAFQSNPVTNNIHNGGSIITVQPKGSSASAPSVSASSGSKHGPDEALDDPRNPKKSRGLSFDKPVNDKSVNDKPENNASKNLMPMDTFHLKPPPSSWICLSVQEYNKINLKESHGSYRVLDKNNDVVVEATYNHGVLNGNYLHVVEELKGNMIRETRIRTTYLNGKVHGRYTKIVKDREPIVVRYDEVMSPKDPVVEKVDKCNLVIHMELVCVNNKPEGLGICYNGDRTAYYIHYNDGKCIKGEKYRGKDLIETCEGSPTNGIITQYTIPRGIGKAVFTVLNGLCHGLVKTYRINDKNEKVEGYSEWMGNEPHGYRTVYVDGVLESKEHYINKVKDGYQLVKGKESWYDNGREVDENIGMSKVIARAIMINKELIKLNMLLKSRVIIAYYIGIDHATTMNEIMDIIMK